MSDSIIDGSGNGWPWVIESGLGLVKQIGATGPIEDPLARFKSAERDQQTSTNRYFGFTDTTGSWYIMQSSGTTAQLVSDRYVAGGSSFIGSWAARATLSYDYLYNVF